MIYVIYLSGLFLGNFLSSTILGYYFNKSLSEGFAPRLCYFIPLKGIKLMTQDFKKQYREERR